MKSSLARGFTLAEVLVALGIIGLLATVVLTSVSQSRANARDKVREADRAQIQLAVRLFQEQDGENPTPGMVCRNCELDDGSINAAVQAFIGTIEDPRHDGTDFYYSLESGTNPGDLEVCVQFERDEIGARDCIAAR